MPACPHCQRADGQVKAGLSGTAQRYKCSHCRRRYTPDPRPRGHSAAVRSEALQLHAAGMTVGQIRQQTGLNPRTIAKWIAPPDDAGAASPPAAPEAAAPAPGGKRRATISDVAGRAGVSTSTISNFLNDKGRMSAQTRARVQAAMDALHFTPSALMRALRQRRTHILGVYIGGLDALDEDVGESVTLPVLAGLNRGAGAGAYNLLQFTGYERHARRTRGREFLDGHIDGLIWVAPPMGAPTLERLSAAGLPVVALLSRHVPDAVGYVNADNLGAMHALVAHLAGRGHRRIAYAGPVHDSNFWDRREGYRQGLATAGLPWEAHLEVSLEIAGEWSPQNFDRALGFDRMLDRWRSLPAPPTAVVLPDDGMALSLGRALLRRGLRVPEDIAIAGFNDTPDAAWALGGLTTLRQPLRRMGEQAVERLLALIGGAPVAQCRVTVPTELIVRASTGGRRRRDRIQGAARSSFISNSLRLRSLPAEACGASRAQYSWIKMAARPEKKSDYFFGSP